MALKDIKASDFKRSRSFSDLLISFAKNSFTDDVSSVKNDNSIKQAIKNLVLTTPGEKPFQPLVGSKVKDLLKGLGLMTAGDFADNLSDEVEALVKKAAKRAQANGRKTVRGEDL